MYILELELRTFVNTMWMLGIKPRTSAEIISALNHCSRFSSSVCMGVLSAHMSVYPCVSGAWRGKKMALDALKLELQMVVCHHVGAGN